MYCKTKYQGVFRYIGKRGECYGIDYRLPNGERVKEILGKVGEISCEDARDELEKRRQAASKGNFVSVADRKKVTFGRLIEEYKKTEAGKPYYEKTRKYHVQILQDYFEPMIDGKRAPKKLFQITPLDVEKFKTVRKETLTQHKKTRSEIDVNRILQTLRHILNKAVQWKWLEKNPFDAFKTPDGRKSTIFYEEDEGRIRYLEEPEIRKLLAGCTKRSAHLKNIIEAAIYTGLRIGDVLKIKWEQVDLQKGVIHFIEAKKKKERIKPLCQDMIDLLLRIKQENALKEINPESVFLGPHKNRPIKSVAKAFASLKRRVGIKNFHIHDLRHTSATQMILRGASMKAVQEHLNHSSPTMTNRYAHVNEEYMRQQVGLLDGLCEQAEGKKLGRNEGMAINKQKVTASERS